MNISNPYTNYLEKQVIANHSMCHVSEPLLLFVQELKVLLFAVFQPNILTFNFNF